MDDSVQDLLQYASKQGIGLNGMLPRRLPGRGYGIVATRDIKEGETVLSVPTHALRTLDTVPKDIKNKLVHDVSVHGILAADLVLENTDVYAAWDAVLPTPEELSAGMPFLWPTELQALLPSPAREALAKQQSKLQRDWEGVKTLQGEARESGEDSKGSKNSAAVYSITYHDYARAWLLVNSRTFYYTTSRSEAARTQHDDRIAMQPVADLFNHAADRGCRVTYSTDGFTFVADRPYAEGDEVPISYGAHANDALLVEYGFILADAASRSRWDEVALDAAVLPRLRGSMRSDLDEAGFLGHYMVDASTPGGCWRTQVALRRILAGTTFGSPQLSSWRQFVENGGALDSNSTEERRAEAQADELLVDILEDMEEEAKRVQEEVEELGRQGVGSEAQRELLSQRWRQIEDTVVKASEQLKEGKTNGEGNATST